MILGKEKIKLLSILFPWQITRWELWLITRESWDPGYDSSRRVWLSWIASSQATQMVYLKAIRLTLAWSTHASFNISQQRRQTQKQKSLSDDLQGNKGRLAALNQSSSLWISSPHRKKKHPWKRSDNTKDHLGKWICMPLVRKLVSPFFKVLLQSTQISKNGEHLSL